MIAWASSGARAWMFDALYEGGHRYYLGSFLEQRTLSRHMISPDQFRFFLDSGAFSAWTKGSVIDIDEYCAFIKANIDHIDVYPCLDVIPGKPGAGNATDKERDAAADQTWANYLYMKREGLDPIPVFHYGEDWRHLTRMVTYPGCDYIGIGGLVGVPGPLRILWLDRLFKRLCDAEGMPIVKTHGFGMTSVPLIFRYPWYSVDSTTWIKITMSGAVLLPACEGGRFIFDKVPAIVSVSDRSPKAEEGGKHVNTMAPTMRRILEKWLAECGKTVQECSEHYYHRAVVNVSFFKRVSEMAAVKPFKTDQIRKQSFF